jgi:hypothetical protein
VDLRRRVLKARDEGRFQQALELAKHLARDATPESVALLREMTLGRARQLRLSGHTRDTVSMLLSAAQAPGLPAPWLEQAAAEIALSGDAVALRVLKDLPETPAIVRVRGMCADACVQAPGENRGKVPPTWHPDLDAVLLASKQIEKGEDEPARTTLQQIGLRSPFLEWKLFLRGLQAYYQNDDPRALENWQRLDLERLPARLAAPFRFQIDPRFRAAQPGATQAALQRQLESADGSGLVQRLRQLQRDLENKESLTAAFRDAESLLPLLRAERPELAPRLASCLYWAVLNTGPADINRYRRIFGAPPEDPNFHRLNALAQERYRQYEEAHEAWGEFERDIAAHPEKWNGQADRARALVLLHMGKIAVCAQEEVDEPEGPFDPFWAPPRRRRIIFDPPPEKCFEQARKLAADLLPAYEGLFRYYLDREDDTRAEKAGRALLERFPDHAPTLQEMARIAQRNGDAAEALRLMQVALRVHPLDRDLRTAVGRAHLAHCRMQIVAKAFDDARAQLQAAQAILGGSGIEAKYIQAALELKANRTAEAEEILQGLLSAGEPALAQSYAMLVESVLCKLPPAIKTRFDCGLKEGLAALPNGKAAARLFQLLLQQDQDGTAYHGQKTHRKKILEYGERAVSSDISEEELRFIVGGAVLQGGGRQLDRIIAQARRRFPKSPYFVMFELSALAQNERKAYQFWRLEPLIREATRLINARPQDENMKVLLEELENIKAHLQQLNPMAFMFDRFASNMDFGPDDDDEDGYLD